jgi:hypothetical protein
MQPHPPPSERSFGISVGAVLVLLGGVALWRHRQTLGTVMAVLGGALLLSGLVAPAVLRVPNRVWWRFAQVLGWVNTRILLSVFFFAIMTPVGVIMRLLGRNPLQPPSPATSWIVAKPERRQRGHFEHLF